MGETNWASKDTKDDMWQVHDGLIVVTISVFVITILNIRITIPVHERPHVTEQTRASAGEGRQKHSRLDQLHCCHGRGIPDGCGGKNI